MKVDTLILLLDKKFKLDKKFYFISGNETTLIQKISDLIINKYQKDHRAVLDNIDKIDNYQESAGLFESKKIFLVKDCKGISENNLSKLQRSNDVFIFKQENSQKIKKIKDIFIRSKESFLFDCYELDKNSKNKILNETLKKNNLILREELYWFLVDKLDNKYIFFENSINKILELNQNDVTLENVKRVLNTNNTGKEKVFFNILKKNSEIVNVYREKIITTSDVNEFYYYCRFFCQLIIESQNEEEFRKKIPVYLFREKNFLIDIYKFYNSKKKKILLKLLSSTETILRKESGQSITAGLRFFLNMKKITIS